MEIHYVKLDSSKERVDPAFLACFPLEIIRRARAFRRVEDQWRFLLGRYLIRTFVNQGLPNFKFEFNKLEFTKEGRPFLPNQNFDFNISHSGRYVVGTFSQTSRVGIDIEFQKVIDLEDFTYTMNDNQWIEVNEAPNPFNKFFWFWTIKESVIKADGRGLAIPLTDIVVENNTVNYDGKIWHLYPFAIDADHKCCLASDHVISTPNIAEVHWQEFR